MSINIDGVSRQSASAELVEIPGYPGSSPIALGDKPLLDGIFSGLQPRISEFTFANLFLFRTAHAYRLTMVGDSLVVLGCGYDGEPYFLPPLTGDLKKAHTGLLGEGMTLYGADERFVNEHLRDSGVEIVEDRDSFDYLYLRSDLAELPGNRFHKKKNRINYFASRHAYLVEPYAEQYLDGCLQLIGEWRRVHAGTESGSLTLETDAAAEALSMASHLGLEGLVVLVEGEVKAFVLGERLNSNTAVCKFEKANPFLEGLYQLINREFCRLLFTDCTYVNREQDLGEANLRETKLSYHPVELVKKFRVRRQPGFRS
jgi:uncharacterized protein